MVGTIPLGAFKPLGSRPSAPYAPIPEWDFFCPPLDIQFGFGLNGRMGSHGVDPEKTITNDNLARALLLRRSFVVNGLSGVDDKNHLTYAIAPKKKTSQEK